jgi:hypothetical protein
MRCCANSLPRPWFPCRNALISHMKQSDYRCAGCRSHDRRIQHSTQDPRPLLAAIITIHHSAYSCPSQSRSQAQTQSQQTRARSKTPWLSFHRFSRACFALSKGRASHLEPLASRTPVSRRSRRWRFGSFLCMLARVVFLRCRLLCRLGREGRLRGLLGERLGSVGCVRCDVRRCLRRRLCAAASLH